MNIEKLKQFFSNDEKLVNQFLVLFKNEVPNQLLKLDKALQEKEWEAVSILAHSIKSQVKYLDLVKIASIAAIIENSAEKKEDLENIPTHIQNLKTSLLELIKTM